MIPDDTAVDPATAVRVLVDAAARADDPGVRRVLLLLAVRKRGDRSRWGRWG